MLRWLKRRLGLRLRIQGHPPQRPQPAHPLNVPGPVYVVDGCCLNCGVWELDAPEHLAWSDEEFGHCYVRRQPANEEELRAVARAMQRQDLDCIRVRNCPDGWRPVLERMGLNKLIDQ